jgi:hypothetical protein
VTDSPEVRNVSLVTAEPVFEETASALQEKKKLRRNFRRFDMFFYLICTIVTLDTAVLSRATERRVSPG